MISDKKTTIIDFCNTNNIKIIDIHVGKTICVIVKRIKTDVLTNLLESFTDINVIEILPTTTGLYHYLFIVK